MSVERPDWDTYFLDIAHMVAMRSTCSRLQVGAVLTREHRILATGYNGTPSGQEHCEHLDDLPCDVTVHAEHNALDSLEQMNSDLDIWWLTAQGATLYVTHAPCLDCAVQIAARGIEQVVYRHPYRRTEGLEVLLHRQVAVRQHRTQFVATLKIGS